MEIMEMLGESKEYIESKLGGRKPQIGLILGSGLGDMADAIEDPVVIDYHDIPHFPVSTVPGHKGRLVIGTLEGKTVLCMQGRFHYYEGYSMEQVVYPVRTMKMLGIENLFLTNAAYILNFDKPPTAKSANPDLIRQCIEEKKRHDQVEVKIVPYHKSPLLITTHQMATDAMSRIRKEHAAQLKAGKSR